MRLAVKCKAMDDLFDGGVESGAITEFYGEAGTGKTTLCLQLTRNCVEDKKKVIFIDTEGVSLDRLKQICGSETKFKSVTKEILFFEPYSLEEQSEVVDKSLKLVESQAKIGLVVLDSATLFYRIALGSENESSARRGLAKQIVDLLSLARKKDLPVILTNQVYTDIENNTFNPIGGHLLHHNAKAIIKLERLENGLRKAIIMKHRSLAENNECLFLLTNKGVEDQE
jgi:DNA repair protein RadB